MPTQVSRDNTGSLKRRPPLRHRQLVDLLIDCARNRELFGFAPEHLTVDEHADALARLEQRTLVEGGWR